MSGWKDWQIGEVVEAGEFQSYVQNQVVQQYPDSAARGSAIATPTTGMVSFIPGNGIEYATTDMSSSRWDSIYTGADNHLLNGGLDIWQRGTAIPVPTTGSFYTADRWESFRAGSAAGATVTRQPSTIVGTRFAARIQRDSGNTSLAAITFAQALETADSLDLAGKNVTLSFYARRGADFAGVFTSAIVWGTGTDQSIRSGFTGSENSLDILPLTTTFVRYTTTVTISSNATQVGVRFVMAETGTAGANDWVEITGVQLETGSIATPFRRNAPSLQAELAACQRYYWRSDSNVNSFSLHGQGLATATTQANVVVNLPVRLRTMPTSVEWQNLQVTDITSAQLATTVAISTPISSLENMYVIVSVASGLTAFRPYFLGNSNTTGFIGFSAEL